MPYVDCGLVLLLVLGGWFSLKKGFVKALLGTVENLGSLLLAIAFSSKITAAIMSMQFYAFFIHWIESFLPLDKMAQSVAENQSVFFQNAFGDMLFRFATVGGQVIIENLAQGIASIIIHIAVFGLLFFFIKLAIRLIAKITDGLMSLPGLHLINKILGFFIGVVKAFMLLYVLSAVIVFIVPMAYEHYIYDAIAGSLFSRFFVEQNVLLGLFI